MPKRFIWSDIKTARHMILPGLMAILFSGIAWGQPTPDPEKPAKNEAEEFINLGYISVSPKYILSTNGKTITYKIRNNATRSISNLYAWIYEVQRKKENDAPLYRLVNNPNKGGLPVKGSAHSPGEIADWRFPLTAAAQEKTGTDYTFRISHRGVFFINLEPEVKNPK